MKNLKYPLLVLAFLFIYSSCSKKDDELLDETDTKIKFQRKELRAAWMATVWGIDWPGTNYNAESQKQAYIDYLELFKTQKLNAVMVQVRPKADAFYASPYEPWSQWITGTLGQNPGYDVLQFMIDETHKRGMEFHAWINPYDITTDANNFDITKYPTLKDHPDWVMRYADRMIFRPSHPEVPTFLINVIDDIATKYDVDGIHFDDYFYPYPVAGATLDDAADYAQYGSGYATIEDFRRGCVNDLIRRIHVLIETKHPTILFSVSPYAVWRNLSQDPINGSATNSTSNYDDLYADIRLWCQEGWLDFVVPQLYQGTNNNYAGFNILTQWWSKHSFDVPVMVGYPLYRFYNAAEGNLTAEELQNEFMYAYKESKIQGGVFYNSTAFKANRGGILEVLDKYYANPALIPFMGRKTLPDPDKVSSLSVNSNSLSWNTVNGTDIRYAVYRIRNNKAQIEAIVTDTSFELTRSGDYCVSAVNAENNEGAYSDIVTYKK